ncbi:hypothetical protein SASPL_146180 [Salvia splendens]|uniref:E3 ubiquitin-protein ligase RMA n=1 Tax=Salvia splendens TaxID=180675 RepID=A0A8X8Z5C2_SALSN|nr:hypothetical protein SASPL_146180 [Salvia splendens]
MAFQHYFMKGWESLPQQSAASEKPSACFDCSICLDFAQDPVVTLCGHLYCWPCIYKWFDSQSSSLCPDKCPQCPVCKAEISEKTMVPLYSRGKSLSEEGAQGKVIPPRPPACGIRGLADLFSPEQQLPYPSRHSYQDRHDYPNPNASYGEDLSPQLFNLGGTAALPPIGMFGEIVYARAFDNSQRKAYTHTPTIPHCSK